PEFLRRLLSARPRSGARLPARRRTHLQPYLVSWAWLLPRKPEPGELGDSLRRRRSRDWSVHRDKLHRDLHSTIFREIACSLKFTIELCRRVSVQRYGAGQVICGGTGTCIFSDGARQGRLRLVVHAVEHPHAALRDIVIQLADDLVSLA